MKLHVKTQRKYIKKHVSCLVKLFNILLTSEAEYEQNRTEKWYIINGANCRIAQNLGILLINNNCLPFFSAAFYICFFRYLLFYKV